MKITDIRLEQTDSSAQLTATFVWETAQRPTADVYFRVPRSFADALSLDGNSFLTAAVFPAVEAGEKRVLVEAPICPRLKSGLETILATFREWYGAPNIAIEASSFTEPNGGRRRAAAFLTGGIDSLATLRRNRLAFPASHPEFILDFIILYGINFDSDDKLDTFSGAVEELTTVATAAGGTLIPVTTNARRELNRDLDFFRYKYHAALLASAAHAMSARVSTVTIASTHDVANLIPWGSHPLIDVNFASADLRIYHDGADMSRFEKTRLVAAWDTGLQNIKVCTRNWPGANCGECEKCLRTILALTALNALNQCASFRRPPLTADEVRRIEIFDDNQATFYVELIGPLQAAGRPDLAQAAEFVLAKYYGEIGARGAVIRWDREHLHGALRAVWSSLRGSASATRLSTAAPIVSKRLHGY